MDEEFYRRQREFLQGVLSQTDVAITTGILADARFTGSLHFVS